MYALEFPTFDSSQQVWSRAASAASATLLGWMRMLTGPHYIPNYLRDPILADLTQQWRDELMTSELTEFRLTTKDEGMRTMLVEWEANLRRPAPAAQRLAIRNAREQWTKLCEAKYGCRRLLAMCAESKRQELSRLFICATVYREELQSLTGTSSDSVANPTTLLTDLLLAATNSKPLAAALAAALAALRDGGDWSKLAIFFAQLRPDDEGEGGNTQY